VINGNDGVVEMLSTPLDTITNLCVKAIDDVGSRVDQLIYGVAEFVHKTVCVGQGLRTILLIGTPFYWIIDLDTVKEIILSAGTFYFEPLRIFRVCKRIPFFFIFSYFISRK